MAGVLAIVGLVIFVIAVLLITKSSSSDGALTGFLFGIGSIILLIVAGLLWLAS